MIRWIGLATVGLVGLLLALSVYVLAAADLCVPAGVASAPTPARPHADTLTPEQLAAVAADAGFTGGDLTIAVAVGLAESGGRPAAVNTSNSDGTSDHGLWQINTVHRSAGFDPARADEPAYNAEWAYRIFSNAGDRWTPWVAHNTGAYRQHMAAARRAAAGAAVRAPSGVAAASTTEPDPAAFCPGAGSTAGGRAPGDTAPITEAELAAIAARLGQPVPGYSVLRDPEASGDGTGGASVNLLTPEMQVAIAKVEIAMGARLEVVSGYRTAAYQAELCARPGIGRCAPPGRSMHQHGLAVDVVNWRQALPHLRAAGLCQPLPADDAVHLSHVDGTEC